MHTITQQIFFAHSGGGQGGPGEGSFDLVSYLRKELASGYTINFELIEDPNAPTYEMWKNLFSKEFSNIEGPIILIGHSLGGSMLLKYLSEERPQLLITALFLVSIPQWGMNGWDVEDFEMRKDFETELKGIDKVFLYHSENDQIVPFEHLQYYKSAFPDAIIRKLKGSDHAFSNGLPELVEDIKALYSVN